MKLTSGLRHFVANVAGSSNRELNCCLSLYTWTNMIEIIDIWLYQIQLYQYYQQSIKSNCWLENLFLGFLIYFKLTFYTRLYLLRFTGGKHLLVCTHTYAHKTVTHTYACVCIYIQTYVRYIEGVQYVEAFFEPFPLGWLHSKVHHTFLTPPVTSFIFSNLGTSSTRAPGLDYIICISKTYHIV